MVYKIVTSCTSAATEKYDKCCCNLLWINFFLTYLIFCGNIHLLGLTYFVFTRFLKYFQHKTVVNPSRVRTKTYSMCSKLKLQILECTLFHLQSYLYKKSLKIIFNVYFRTSIAIYMLDASKE